MPEPIFTPSGIIDIYNNSIHIPQESSVITVKGVYNRGTDTLYANQYYDSLIDEMGIAKITIKTNQIQRNKLVNGKLATILGVLNRRIRNDSTIAVSINVTDILIIEDKKITEVEKKLAEIQQKKISIGYKVPEQIIKQKLYKNQKPNVALVFASGTIVQPEFTNALSYASDFINFSKRDISFSNANNVLNLFRLLSSDFEIIAIIRGGGAGQDLFDDINFNNGILGINSCFISAIGHNPEKFFFKNIADKVIDTPTALGSFFRNLVDEYKSEIANSKAVLTEQVKLQFQNQIKTITEQNERLNTQIKQHLANNQKLVDQANKSSNELINANKQIGVKDLQIKQLQDENNKKKSNSFLYVIIVILIGIIIYLLVH